MKKQTICLLPFEVKTEPTKFLVSATADAWYDLIGIYHVFDIKNKELLHSISIKDNSKKFEELAKFCFNHLMPSKDFKLLSQYSEYKTLYKTIENKPIQQIHASKRLYDNLEQEVCMSLMLYDGIKEMKNIDISDSRLRISNTVNKIPLFLENWDGGWAFDDIYIYEYRTKRFIYHFSSYCPYETDDNKVTDTRQDIANSFTDETKYLMLTPINRFQELWEYDNKSLNRLTGN